MRKAQTAAGKKPMYDGRSRNLGLKKSDKTVLRLATPEDGEIIVNDLIRGEIKFNNNELDDLILLRSDGSPTYHLCNVVDDYEQKVTTVIRGEDHISNTPRQIHIQNALGYPELDYAHLPLVLGTDKKRLSKRNAATSLEEYRDKGYLDSAILNTLARLGWSHGENDVFYMNHLIKEFNIKDVQKAGAIFDITKLDWLNSQHLANLSLESFKEQLQPFLQAYDIDIEDHENSDQLIEAMRTSDSTCLGIAKSLIPYYKDVKEYDEKAIKKFVADKSILEELKVLLNELDEWDQDNIDSILKNYQTEKGLSVPAVNQPIRISLTGSTKSPGLGLTLFLFGKNKSLERMSSFLAYLS
jgi:glutamyl-tRNA synthetase